MKRFAWGILTLMLSGCNGNHPAVAPQLPAAEREDIRREFEAVCLDLKASDNEYYGTAQVARLDAILRRAPDAALPQSVIRAQLAMELLRTGETESAVQRLAESFEIAGKAGLPDDLLDDIERRYALALLRLAETTNCVGHHTPDSCIVPFSAAAVHAEPDAALAALEHYSAIIERGAATPTVHWLAQIAAGASGMPNAGLPEQARWTAPPSEQPFPRFHNVAHERGLMISEPSGGVAADDFDNDGDIDLIVSTIDPCRGIRYFENDGTGNFKERTEEAGLSPQGGALNLVHADVDNDGDRDLLALRGGWLGTDGRIRNSLLINDGKGTFSDVTHAAGLAEPAYPGQTAVFGDFNLDARMDIYFGSEADNEGNPYPSQMFFQLEDGTFEDRAALSGTSNDRFTKGIGAADIDADGDLDLYVSNLGPNRLYINRGDGTFQDEAELRGVVEPRERSFPVAFFDYDQDGYIDLVVGDYGASLDDVADGLMTGHTGKGAPLLYRNRGDGFFDERGAASGFDDIALPMGFAAGDLDDDGFPDLYMGTGTPNFESIAPNLMYRNLGGRFDNISYSSGFAHLQKGHGIAFADFDNDGDVDLFEQMGGAYPGDAYPSVLYDNPGDNGNFFLTLKLIGTKTTRDPIGAHLTAIVQTSEGPRSVFATVRASASFGGSPLDIRLGLGDARIVERLEIRWPGGGDKQIIVRPSPGEMLTVKQE